MIYLAVYGMILLRPDAIWEKMISAEKLANEYEIPIIRLIEGTWFN